MLNCQIRLSQVWQTRDEASAEGARGLVSEAREYLESRPRLGRLRPTSASIRRTQSCPDLDDGCHGEAFGDVKICEGLAPCGANRSMRRHWKCLPSLESSASVLWAANLASLRPPEPAKTSQKFMHMPRISEVQRAQAPRRPLWWRRLDHPACRGRESAKLSAAPWDSTSVHRAATSYVHAHKK